MVVDCLASIDVWGKLGGKFLRTVLTEPDVRGNLMGDQAKFSQFCDLPLWIGMQLNIVFITYFYCKTNNDFL